MGTSKGKYVHACGPLCRGGIIQVTAGTILQMDDCVQFLYVIVHVPVKADNTY